MLSLCELVLGGTAEIQALETCGEMRRRLLDLGFVPGAQVKPLFRGSANDPTAYLISGAVIALRREDAAGILVNGV